MMDKGKLLPRQALDLSGKPGNRLNLGLLCMIALIEGADIQLLPASFRAMEADLALSPARLAVLTLLQGCAGAITGPLWASLTDNGFSRRKLLSLGALGWGLLTFALAGVRNYTTMAVWRTLNGVALGMMLPVLQSLVADSVDKSQVGFTFGCLQFYTNFGQVFGAVAVTSMSNRIIYGVQGWRIAFAAVAVASIFVAALVNLFLAEEPRPWRPERIGFRQEVRKLFTYLRIRSFFVIVVQGMFGTIPWAAMAFSTMYFQYLGFSDAAASMVYGTSIVGTALGGVLGGVISDRLAAWSPYHGRVITAQITAVMGIPFVLLIFLWVPYGSPPALYAVLCFCLGLFSSWASSGCNRPIFTEIVPPGCRASAMAWEVTLESTCGFLLGPAAVGLLAEHAFGYKMNQLQVSQMSTEDRLANARALGHGMAIMTAVPWSFCVFFYTFLHRTLAEDISGASLSSDTDSLGLGVTASETTPLAAPGATTCSGTAAMLRGTSLQDTTQAAKNCAVV